MIENIMPGVWVSKPKALPSMNKFEPAKCDPLDFETRLKNIRQYGETAVETENE